MAKEIEILLPKMGESVAEATVIKWLKEEGDAVEADEPIIEIATDKVDSEVPAPSDGILSKQLCGEGDVVQVGAAIAMLKTEAGDDSASNDSPAPAPKNEEKSSPKPAGVEASNGAAPRQPVNSGSNGSGEIQRSGQSGRFYSPLVRNIAVAEGVTMEELESIPGTGSEGRVTKKDILAYIPQREEPSTGAQQTTTEKAAPEPSAKAAGVTKSVQAPAVSVNQGDEIIEMDRMRKLIADHMVMSKHTSPHVTSFVEADVTNLVRWRNKVKDEFQKREGEKITFTPIFIEAIVKAIKDFPMINISLDHENYKIIKRKAINIGMAAALPSGNLIVPVIRNADTLNLTGLTKKVNDLANRARNNALKPEEITGGTYTVTNVGSFGNVMGTPIINQPQVAIMATGAIRKKPAVLETEAGDVIAVRHMMYLSHSYDHRIVDGALGGSFLRKVADYLEQFDVERTL